MKTRAMMKKMVILEEERNIMPKILEEASLVSYRASKSENEELRTHFEEMFLHLKEAACHRDELAQKRKDLAQQRQEQLMNIRHSWKKIPT